MNGVGNQSVGNTTLNQLSAFYGLAPHFTLYFSFGVGLALGLAVGFGFIMGWKS